VSKVATSAVWGMFERSSCVLILAIFENVGLFGQFGPICAFFCFFGQFWPIFAFFLLFWKFLDFM
jgi:hypothetical protein